MLLFEKLRVKLRHFDLWLLVALFSISIFTSTFVQARQCSELFASRETLSTQEVLEQLFALSKERSSSSTFQANEFVQFGGDINSNHEYKDFAIPSKLHVFSGHKSYYIGRFVKNYDSNHVLVSFENRATNTFATIIVPRNDIQKLNTGLDVNFLNSMKFISSIPLTFAQNEVVRFRDLSGNMAVGTFVMALGSRVLVKTNEGENLTVNQEDVFRFIGGSPLTTRYDTEYHREKNSEMLAMTFAPEEKLVRKFLNGAARLTSLVDFKKLPTEEKILALMAYLKLNVSWTHGAVNAELASLKNFSDVLCSDAGVCRHLSVLMKAILNETGFLARAVYYKDPESDFGHMWVELDVPQPNGTFTTYVVDPSYGYYLKAYSEISAIAEADKNSFEAMWYTQTQRKTLRKTADP
jgi:hypothetical protein